MSMNMDKNTASCAFPLLARTMRKRKLEQENSGETFSFFAEPQIKLQSVLRPLLLTFQALSFCST